MFAWLAKIVVGVFSLIFASFASAAGAHPATPPATVPPVHLTQKTTSSTTAPAPAAYSGPVYYKNVAVVLMYHNLGSVNRGDTITQSRFEGEVSALKKAGFHVVPMAQLEAFLYSGGSLPPNAVLLTFDDGYESFYSEALPVLKKEQVPATSFLIVGRISTQHTASGLPVHDMTWPQIQAAAKTGYAFFSSHTYALHHAIRSGPKTTSVADAVQAYANGKKESVPSFLHRVSGDLCKAASVIKQKVPGGEPRYFAYPYGAYGPLIFKALHLCGYRMAFTTEGYGVTAFSDPLRLGRINVGTPRTSPQSIVGLVKSVGERAAAHPHQGPPPKHIPQWRG